ncbi:MAG: fumarate hydratase [Clostridia bacterium]
MRKINVVDIIETVRDMCIQANCCLNHDVTGAIITGITIEESDTGKEILSQLIENATIAENEMIPICQDTGMVICFIEIGQEVYVDGNLEEAINEGVRRGYEEGFLRKSVVSDPLLRCNTGDNTPAIIHYEIVSGDRLKISIAPKGFGSENMSALKMLKPSDGVDGVIVFVLETVSKAGPNPCPPIVVGVGIGGTMEKAALLAKKSLLRPLNETSNLPHIAELEKTLLVKINELGIGPGGLGGNITSLGVNVEVYPTHIAGLPVAVNLSCHVTRHMEVVL